MKILEMVTPMSNSRLLHTYLREQHQFQRSLILAKYGKEVDDLSPEELNQILIKMVLSVHSESSELLDVSTNWKMHKRDHAIDRARTLEEYVDLLKFVLNIAVYLNIDEAELNEAWDAKTNVVWDRLAQDLAASPTVERQEGRA